MMFDDPKIKVSKVVVSEPNAERFSAIQETEIHFDSPVHAIKHLFGALDGDQQNEVFAFFARTYLDEHLCSTGRLTVFAHYCAECGELKNSPRCCQKLAAWVLPPRS